MTARPLRLVVVSAGLRSPSTTGLLADQLTSATFRGFESVDRPVEVRRIEVRDHAHAIADALLTGFPTGELSTALTDVAEADALIVVTPTFQASYSGLFKSFFDLVESLAGIPVLLAATGGTERHSLVLEHALRPLVAHLGGLGVPTGVFGATSDFGGSSSPALAARIERAAGELATLAGGSSRPGSSARSSALPHATDPFDEVEPFEETLRRLSS